MAVVPIRILVVAFTAAVWMLPAAAQGFQSRPLEPARGGKPGFEKLPAEITGITFTNRLSDFAAAQNRILANGSGVALGDVDGDGRCDIYFCSISGGNTLYRNLGNWRFEDITAAAGVTCTNQASTGAVLVDVDGDRDLDLLVNGIGAGTREFLNDGQGHFTEVTDSRLVRRFGATSLALADMDGDGDLDLYVTNYRTDTFKDRPAYLKVEAKQLPDGSVVVEPQDRFIALGAREAGIETLEKGERDFLYVNTGKGRFAPVAWDKGAFLDEDGRPLAAPPTDWGLGVLFRDFNGDGWPDLYVCNDFVYWPDRIWLNRQGRGFQAAPRTMCRNQSLSSMAVDAADLNRDGHDDLFVADMLTRSPKARAWQRPNTLAGSMTWPIEDPQFRPEFTRNTLQIARGDGTFAEIAQYAGLAATEWTWSAAFLDVDLDGWEDLLLATGNLNDVQDADALAESGKSRERPTPESKVRSWALFSKMPCPKLAYRNRHDLTFADASVDWGFADVAVAHGMAFADLDNDGDLDAVVNHMNGSAGLYRNQGTAPRLAVRLRGEGANTYGVGARITVTGGPVEQSQVMIAGGRYCSGDDLMRVFATGDATELTVKVRWPDNRESVVPGVKPGQLIEVSQTAAATATNAATNSVPVRFEEVSSRLKHLHVDEGFDDFSRQKLLPRRLSTLGPGLAWADVNGDGHDDLLIGGGKGGELACFNGDGKGGFKQEILAGLTRNNPRDQSGLAVWRDARGMQVLVGNCNWKDGNTNAPVATQLDLAAGKVTQWPGATAGSGPVAVADYDADGDLDVFIGGVAVAGRWPEGAGSTLYRNDRGTWVSAWQLPEPALVMAATFTDLNGDGRPELVLATDWGALRVFDFHGPQPAELTATLGLEALTGWWRGVAAGDFDGDGRMDLVAANWGANCGEGLVDAKGQRWEVRFADWNQAGSVEALVGIWSSEANGFVPMRERKAVLAALPAMAAQLPTHRAYGNSTLESLAQAAGPHSRREVRELHSLVLLNRGDRFDAHPLPAEAQWAPAFGVCVSDFDGDGREDVFLTQNFFGVDPETSRHDAGTGLLLLGDGQGGFRAVPPREAGIHLDGEGRGVAAADFDGDCRVDLAMAQYRMNTRLYHNLAAKPGVRVQLRGTGENVAAVGAVVRLGSAGKLGPARELHAGGGWWSQDSFTLVLAAAGPPDSVWIRWPGGREETVSWPKDAQLLTVQQSR